MATRAALLEQPLQLRVLDGRPLVEARLFHEWGSGKIDAPSDRLSPLASPGRTKGAAITRPLVPPSCLSGLDRSLSGDDPVFALRNVPAAERAPEPTAPVAAHYTETSRSDDGSGGDTDPLVGFVVAGRYRIRRLIARGGMGQVYEVEHTELGKLLALKMLPGALAHDRNIALRFKREAHVISRLSHPNTVHVFDYGTTDGLTWLLMELVPGEDLSTILHREGPMGWKRLVGIASQVCNSLAEAHALGIVHRDIKPGNVMITRAPTGEDFVKVLDFGLAKLRDGAAPDLCDLSNKGVVVGTPHFIAPEQIRGEASADGRADIYALGALLYRALTGQTLFSGTPREMFVQHLRDLPIPPDVRAPDRDIPRALSDIVVRTLQKDPSARFARVEDLRDALLALTASESGRRSLRPPAPDPAFATRDDVAAFERTLVRQRRLGRAILGMALAATVATAAYAFDRGTEATPFTGEEVEPNDTVAAANLLPFGATVRGTIGRRIDAATPDRDVYLIDVPAGGPVALRTSTLPNMGLCTLIYERGQSDPLARLCPGRPKLGLDVPAVRLAEGSYVVVVTQDLSPHGASVMPDVVENVSDEYRLEITTSVPTPGQEIEPNDTAAAASAIGVGESLAGTLGWSRDVDVVCAKGGKGSARWIVSDPNEGGVAILLATSREVTVEPGGTWRSEPFDLARPACLTLQRAPGIALGVSPPRWTVRLSSQ